MPVQFHEKEFSITHGTDKIVLLPKEYALLRFLYDNHDLPFTREDLLDRVWPLEAPVDRTVDDHIYRLRKKTKRWDHLFTLDTIRGSGYRLTLKAKANAAEPRPLDRDPEITETMMNLIRKYHLFGQGEAVRVLIEHQAALGVSLPHSDEMRMRFMTADIEWILKHRQGHEAEHAYFLLFALLYVQEDAKQAVPVFERALEKGFLSHYWRLDIELALVKLYMDAGCGEQAFALFRKAEQEVVGEGITTFLIFLRLHEFNLHFYSGRRAEAASVLDEVEALLVQYPYQREKGIFTIAKGVWELAHERHDTADALFAEGLQILRESQFVSHVLTGLHAIRRAIERFAPDWPQRVHYQKLWDDIAERHRFAELKAEMVKALADFLR